MPQAPLPADEVISASRAPLRSAEVAAALAETGFPGPLPVLLGSVGSTNVEAGQLHDDLACVVAEEQVAGRGCWLPGLVNNRFGSSALCPATRMRTPALLPSRAARRRATAWRLWAWPPPPTRC